MVILETFDLHESVISLKFSVKIQVKYKSNIAMVQKYNEQKRWRNKNCHIIHLSTPYLSGPDQSPICYATVDNMAAV